MVLHGRLYIHHIGVVSRKSVAFKHLLLPWIHFGLVKIADL